MYPLPLLDDPPTPTARCLGWASKVRAATAENRDPEGGL